MPIPPRPIPRKQTPAQKASCSTSTIRSNSSQLLDWRAEVAFLDSYAASKPKSLPPGGCHGVMMMDAATRARMMSASSSGEMGNGAKDARVEVDLERLIHDGKGKREKRSSTAATLGFDFIHTPHIMVLPDIRPSSSSLLSTSKPSHPITARPGSSSILPPSPAYMAYKHLSASPPLSSTPQTPALVATTSKPIISGVIPERDEEDEDDSDLDEWEHVEPLDNGKEGGEDLEGTMMMLGDMELESELDIVDRKEAVGMRRIEGLSYAAVLAPK